MAQMLRSGNPQQMVEQAMRTNPQIRQVIDQYGDPKTAFYKVAEQQGINPDDVLNMLR